MPRFASNRLAAQRDDERSELARATLADADGVRGTFASDQGGGEPNRPQRRPSDPS